jgi:hypothetical protein
MNKLTDFLQTLTEQELLLLPQLIKDKLAVIKEEKKRALQEQILMYHRKVNKLNRRIYTAKEIATILNTKEYFVLKTIKQFKDKQ